MEEIAMSCKGLITIVRGLHGGGQLAGAAGAQSRRRARAGAMARWRLATATSACTSASRSSNPIACPGLSCDDGETAFKITAGGIASNIFRREVGYLNMGKIDFAGGSQRAQGLNLSLVGSLPIAAGFSAFGKIGTTYGWTDTSGSAAGCPHRFGERLRPELRARCRLPVHAATRSRRGIRAAQLRFRARRPDAGPDVGGPALSTELLEPGRFQRGFSSSSRGP